MSIAQQIGIIGNSLKVNNLPEASATTYGTGNRFYTLVGTQDGFKTGHTYKTVNNDGVYSWADTKSVQNKLPLVVGTQSANNLYDINASDLEGVTEIGGSAFYNRNGLANISLPTTCTNVLSAAFNGCASLISVDMPNVTIIESQVFQNCNALTSVNMPNLELINGTYAFNGCASLISVDMPNVTDTGTYTFSNCTKLASVSMSNVVRIGSNCFQSCRALQSLTIPSTCTSIEASGLKCGSSSNKCTFTFEGTTPPTITTSTFTASYINKIIVPVGCGETYKTATNWTTFADYIEEATE